MTENHSFFDADEINESTWNTYMKMFMARDGYLVDSTTSNLAVIQNTPTAMNVLVGSGKAFVQGIRYENTAAKTVSVDAADSTYTRIDRIVLRITWASNTMQAVYLKGTAAASPVAPALTQSTAVWEHSLYILTIPAGTTAITTAMISDERVRLYGTSVQFLIDGGGAAIATGPKCPVQVPFGCTVVGWAILADQSGSIAIDVKKSTYSGYPTAASIAGSALPTISSATKATSSTLTGWTTAISEGDILIPNVNSCTTITQATLILFLSR